MSAIEQNTEELKSDTGEIDEEETDNDDDTEDNVSPTINNQNLEESYNFEKTTIILGLQILPMTSESLRRVLISAGIKGEPPIISITTLSEIEQYTALADILNLLKESLPQMAEKAKQREVQKQQSSANKAENARIIKPPELPPTTATQPKSSNQLSLF